MLQILPMYALLAAATILTPGAGVFFTVTSALKYGVRYSWPAVAGNTFGVIAVSLLTAGGIGKILSESPTLFTVLQAAGGLYLIWLGVKNLRIEPADLGSLAVKACGPAESQMTLFRESTILQGTNPMLFLFLFALFPQFVSKSEPFWPQALVLIAVFAFLMILIHGGYAVVATFARNLLRGKKAARIVYRTGGVLFIGLGLLVFGKIACGLLA